MSGLNFGDELAPSKLFTEYTEPFVSAEVLIPVPPALAPDLSYRGKTAYYLKLPVTEYLKSNWC